MSYTFTPLPVSETHPRDPNFCTPAEAQAVADSLLSAMPPGSTIQGVQAAPPAPNIYPDGRIYILLNFTMVMDVINSFGRPDKATVPFSEVAGMLVDFVPVTAPWKFVAESTGKDSWLGDVNKGV